MTEVLSLKVENELVDKGSVEITKVDKESGALLKGVTFEVQDEKRQSSNESKKQIKKEKRKFQIYL